MEQFFTGHSQWIILLIIFWSLPWKGVALWKAARNGSRGWFLILFLFNTLAVLEILYIFIFSRKKIKEESF